MILDAGTTGAKPTIVIVGNGMVSYSLCSKLVADGASDSADQRFKIIVIGEENRPAYDRVHLTRYFENHSADDLLLASKDWYRANDIDLRLGQKVVEIVPAAKTVTTSTGDTVHYDKLVLATGSHPFVPDIRGVNEEGVFD